MVDFVKHKIEVIENGFSTIDGIYSDEEIDQISATIDKADNSNETFRKSADVFAIRQFLKEVPQSIDLVFNDSLKNVISQVFGKDYFVVKSIYFDKPESSNWYVSFHQDLTISVDKKVTLENFGPWTLKQNQFAVQPPIGILENIFTIRIHLDDTDENNGALRVMANSHSNKIVRPETINWETQKETTCKVKRGGIMLMKPLLMHSSSRTTNNKRRRIIHIEFSNQELPQELKWAERMSLK